MAITRSSASVELVAGVPNANKTVYHRSRFKAGDPVALIHLANGQRIAIVRDVELPRARKEIPADQVFCYEDFQPPGGLSGDRGIRAAQAVAQCLQRSGVDRVRTDRTLSLLFVREIEQLGIGVELDLGIGVEDRRRKTDEEVQFMRTVQRITESVIEQACARIARAEPSADGVLIDRASGEVLTSERVKVLIDGWLSERGCAHDGCIVAGGPIGADCHHAGTGDLRTGELIIVDVFPRDRANGYYGDCTRTVVHGDIPDLARHMHAAVAQAKRAGIAACRAGVSGEDVHQATVSVLQREGYALGPAPDGQLNATEPTGFCSMPHGTGHGLGLELKELPLLDFGGPELVVGDTVTVEPGLYAPGFGGVRIEDMVVVREGGCENLNQLHDGLEWA